MSRAKLSVKKQYAYTKHDFIKTRVVFRILFLVAFMSILSLVYIWSRVQVVHYGYEINNLKFQQQQLMENNKRLKIELQTLQSPLRIQNIAAEELKMKPAILSQMKQIEEVKYPLAKNK